MSYDFYCGTCEQVGPYHQHEKGVDVTKSTQWVCSKWNTNPKDEEKWEVAEDKGEYWLVFGLDRHRNAFYHFPKSEYVPCPAPEQWERVEVTVSELYSNMDGIYRQTFSIPSLDVGDIKFHYPGYRVVSLVVERRKE